MTENLRSGTTWKAPEFYIQDSEDRPTYVSSRQRPGPRQASQVETACAPQHTGNIYILKYIPKIYARGYRHRVPSPAQQPRRNAAQPCPTCSAFLPIPSQPPGQASSSIPAPWKSICKPALWFLSVTADTVLKCNERFPCTFANHLLSQV